jgi:hypothetical protein
MVILYYKSMSSTTFCTSIKGGGVVSGALASRLPRIEHAPPRLSSLHFTSAYRREHFSPVKELQIGSEVNLSQAHGLLYRRNDLIY